MLPGSLEVSLLPSWESAQLDIAKLRDYCLDPGHPDGQHKARVLRAALGIRQEDARWLRDEILRQLPFAEVVSVRTDQFGARYNVDIKIRRQQKQAVIRTSWIVSAGNDGPRFITCRVL